MKFSITEYRSMRDPLPIFHNNKKIQEVQWNQKVFLRAYMDALSIQNIFFILKYAFWPAQMLLNLTSHYFSIQYLNNSILIHMFEEI